MALTYEIVSCIEEHGYRYRLDVSTGRRGQRLLVVQLNPSTAGSSRSDPTVGKVSCWAAENGFRAVTFTNLFAKRTPHPKELQGSYRKLTGPRNDSILRAAAREADVIVLAWGTVPPRLSACFERRCAILRAIFGGRVVHAVGRPTRTGSPRHGRMWNRTDRSLRIHVWPNI